MNTITAKRVMLSAMSVTFVCGALFGAESIQQKVGALVAKQDVPQLVQMCEEALRPGADAERAELCTTIIDHAKREDVPAVVKGELLTLLVRFGGAESVDFLAGLLAHQDPLVSTRAVLGLQRNASEAAAAALRKALAGASEPEKRAALIHALSLRGDRASLPQLIKDAAGPEDAVRSAALLAVARISDEPANALFKASMSQGSARVKREATDAYLLHADRLAKIGKKQESLAIYHELVGTGGYVKAASMMGMAQVGGAAELTAILQNMKGAERGVIDVTGRLFEHIPKSGTVVAAVCETAKTADPALKARLIEVLGQYADPAGLDAVLEAAKDANQAVRTAAVSALGRFSDKRASEAIVAVLVAGKDTAVAVKAVGAGPRDSIIVDGLVAALPGTSGAVRVSLVRALGACPAGKVVPVLVKAAEDADAAVRTEVFGALRRIGDPSAYAQLVERLAEESDPTVQTTAVNVMAALGARIKEPSQRTAPVLARLAAGGSPGRPALLQLLARISTTATQETGLKFVREALTAQEENLRRAAIRAMGDWPDPDPVLDALLQTAKAEPASVFGVLALRAYCKQVGALAEKRGAAVGEKRMSADDAQKEIIRRCTEGIQIAAQPAEKMGFLSVLKGQPHPDALKVAAGYLGDPNVKKEAVQAAWSIASAIHQTHADAVRPVLEQIKKATDDKKLQPQVEQLLKSMRKAP